MAQRRVIRSTSCSYTLTEWTGGRWLGISSPRIQIAYRIPLSLSRLRRFFSDKRYWGGLTDCTATYSGGGGQESEAPKEFARSSRVKIAIDVFQSRLMRVAEHNEGHTRV